MITQYHRPQTIDEALALLSRPNVQNVLAGGGTTLNRLEGEAIEVIDLQSLGLNHIRQQGNWLSLGATLQLQPESYPATGELVKPGRNAPTAGD